MRPSLTQLLSLMLTCGWLRSAELKLNCRGISVRSVAALHRSGSVGNILLSFIQACRGHNAIGVITWVATPLKPSPLFQLPGSQKSLYWWEANMIIGCRPSRWWYFLAVQLCADRSGWLHWESTISSVGG